VFAPIHSVYVTRKTRLQTAARRRCRYGQLLMMLEVNDSYLTLSVTVAKRSLAAHRPCIYRAIEKFELKQRNVLYAYGAAPCDDMHSGRHQSRCRRVACVRCRRRNCADGRGNQFHFGGDWPNDTGSHQRRPSRLTAAALMTGRARVFARVASLQIASSE